MFSARYVFHFCSYFREIWASANEEKVHALVTQGQGNSSCSPFMLVPFGSTAAVAEQLLSAPVGRTAPWRVCADSESPTTEPWHKIQPQVAAFPYVNGRKIFWNVV